jgi:putative phage-type endonuclease
MKKQAALRLVDTRTIDRRQWLGVRKGGIGSSDAAAAVGLNPYKSPLELWLEKTGRVEVVEQREDMEAATYWGTLLEPLVAAAYTAKTGNKVRRLNAVLQHPSFPYLLANIDREVIGQTGVQILECKTAGEFGSRLWKDGVPEYVQLQVQHQLAVTGKQAADVAVLLCGQKLEIHRIERDEALIARLIVLETRFWDMVEQDIDPPADGSASSARALRQLYRGNDTRLDFTADEALNQQFEALVALNAELDAKGQLAEQLKQTLQQAIGDASKAVFRAGEVSFKRSKDGSGFDTQRFKADHPDLAAQYASIKPGTRRFVLSLAADIPH